MLRTDKIAGCLVAAGLLFSMKAEAEHGMPGYAVLLEAETPVPTNTLIPLAGSNGVPFSLDDLRKGRIRAVEDGSEKSVPLKIEDTYDDMEGHASPFPDDGGGYGENLVLLAPARTLRAGASYRLEIDLDPEAADAPPYVLHRFRVGEEPDREAPEWRRAPFLRLPEVDKENEMYGRLPSLTPTLVTAVDGFGDRPGFIAVDLLPLDKGARKKRVIATLFPKDAQTEAEPCGTVARYDHEHGVFTADTDRDLGRRYRARLTAVDGAGNRTVAPGPGVEIVWNTLLRVCNVPGESPPSKGAIKAPKRTGAPSVDFEADPYVGGVGRYDDLSPFSQRIRIPVETETSLFAEVVLSPSAPKKRRPLRFLASLPKPDAAAPTAEVCASANIANDDRMRLLSTPDTLWEAKVHLTDPLGRRLGHGVAPLRFRLSPLHLSVCIDTSPPSDTASEGATGGDAPSLRWRSPPMLRLNGFTPGIEPSDLLLVDIEANGPVYVRAAASPTQAKGKPKPYPLSAMIDPRGGPHGILKHGCARLTPDPKSPAVNAKTDAAWAALLQSGPVLLKISAMDRDGTVVPAPAHVIWTRPETRPTVCIPEAVSAIKSAF